MAEFTYVARDMSGEKITGSMTANSERDVITMLTGKSLFPVRVESQEKKQIQFGGRGVSAAKVSAFYEQLASLIKNGVPLLRSLVILRDQTSIIPLKKALEDVITRVEEGETLSQGFARHPKVFNEMAVNMARAGGEGGFLEEALERVALFTEQQSELKSRTIGALIYPAVLMTIGTIVVSVLLVFFVPQFGVLFDQLRAKGELPAATDWLLWLSDTLQKYGIFMVAALAILIVIARVQLGTEKGRWFADGLKLKLPLFGVIFRNLAIARFCRVLGTLLKNGVPILKGLEISGEAAGNRVLSSAILAASENITSGEALSVPLGASGHFPQNITEMISVAEESNTLDGVLVSAAEGLEKQTLRRLDLMVKLLEPLMLLVMAAIVLFVVVALLMPVIKMGEVMGG
jgi:general secretion pathway protein F/type IV pilus assembly protein PilC